jgi:hypothetical protein
MFSAASKTGGGQIAGNDAQFNYVTQLIHADGTNGSLNNTIIDSSTGALTITRAGTPAQGSFGPNNYNYSLYGNNTDATRTNVGYVTTPTNNYCNGWGDTVWGPKSTIEFWIYVTSATLGSVNWEQLVIGDSSTTAYASMWYVGLVATTATSALTVEFYASGTTPTTPSVTTATINQNSWNHIAVTIDATTPTSSTIVIYINGVGTTFSALNMSTHNSHNGQPTHFMGTEANRMGATGYLSNVRISRGNSLVYTGNFSGNLPTQNFVPDASTKLLMFQQGNFLDESPFKQTKQGGNTAFSLVTNGYSFLTPFSPYKNYGEYAPNGYSGIFYSTYITFPNTPALQMGTGDFTWECWFFMGTPAVLQGIVGLGGTSTGFEILITAANKIALTMTTTTLTGATTLTYNTWYHIAAVRNGSATGNVKLYINGALDATSVAAVTDNYNQTTAFYIGAGRTGGSTNTGLVSNVRVTKGLAVYTGTFTTPTTALASTQSSGTNIAAITQTTASYYLNATNATVPSNGWTSLAGQFTIEYWTNFISAPTTNPMIGVLSAGGFNIYNDGTRITPNLFGSANIFNSTFLLSGITLGNWYHIAVTRNAANLMTMWVNGSSVGSATTTTVYTVGAWQIGNAGYVGYVSNFRATLGVAVYTGTFTPPAAPLALTQSAGTNIAALTQPSYGNYFNGTSQALYFTAGTSVNLGTGDYTIEAWVYVTSTAAAQKLIFCNWAGGANSYQLYLNGATNQIAFQVFNQGNTPGASDVVPTNAWTHVAISKIGTTLYVFNNGTLTTTTTGLTNSAAGTLAFPVIGAASGGSSLYFPGYISNLRITKGQGLFTGNFTPSTSPLTTTTVGATGAGAASTLTGVVALLTCQSTTFIDNSSSAYALTNVGSTFISPFNPFATGSVTLLTAQSSSFVDATATAATLTTTGVSVGANPFNTPYVALLTCQSPTFVDNSSSNGVVTVNGLSQTHTWSPFGYTAQSNALVAYNPTTAPGSIYLNGSTDYLSLPSNVGLQMGASDFTIESWVYPTIQGNANGGPIISLDVNASFFAAIRLGFGTFTAQSGFPIFLLMSVNGTTWDLNVTSGIGVLMPYFWSHVAVTKTGTSVRVFINGVQQGSTQTLTSATLMTGTSYWVGYLNAASVQYYTGYQTSVRVTKGTNLYTGPFQPPAAPLSPVTNTTLLLLGSNAAIYDYSQNSNLNTITASISTSVRKYGTGSIAFVGTGYIKYPLAPGWQFAFLLGDFTVEFWMYVTSTPTTEYIIWESQTTGAFTVHKRAASSGLSFNAYGGTERLIQADASIPLNTWQFIAISRNSGTTNAYVNSTRTLTFADTQSYALPAAATPYTMGARNGGTLYMPGYIDDFRITLGVGRYSGATITVPQQAFPNQ